MATTITRTNLKKLILKKLEIIGGTETASSDLNADVEFYLDWFVEEAHNRSSYIFDDAANTFPIIAMPYVVCIVANEVADVLWVDVDVNRLAAQADRAWMKLAAIDPIETSEPANLEDY